MILWTCVIDYFISLATVSISSITSYTSAFQTIRSTDNSNAKHRRIIFDAPLVQHVKFTEKRIKLCCKNVYFLFGFSAINVMFTNTSLCLFFGGYLCKYLWTGLLLQKKRIIFFVENTFCRKRFSSLFHQETHATISLTHNANSTRNHLFQTHTHTNTQS